MPSLKRAFKYFHSNHSQFLDSTVKNLGFLFPDKLYLSLRYRFQMGKWIDWINPKLFTEKIQWLKVYGFKPEYSMMVDKYAVKDYVAGLLGEQYIIPTLGVWDKPEEIDWDSLPDKFVLKTTNGGGGTGVVICQNKSILDKNEAIKKLSYHNAVTSDGKEFREHQYYNVKQRIIAEQLIPSPNGDLTDYKFYCFNGKPEYCQVIRDRRIKETIDFYDMDWNLMPFVGLNPKCENGLQAMAKPKCLDEMIMMCQTLSKDIPFCRIDLYNVDDRPLFGEITFYPASGFGRFKPTEWDEKLGSMIKLPQ